MKKLSFVLLMVLILALAACSNKEEATQSNAEGSEVGFELTGDNIEEAANVPKDKKEEIIAAFDEYIGSFNDKDITRYLATLSQKTESFDYAEQEQSVQVEFDEYDTTRKPTDTTIVKYKENEAQVFANVEINRLEKVSGKSADVAGRQVTVFALEDNTWKVSGVYFIANAPPTE